MHPIAGLPLRRPQPEDHTGLRDWRTEMMENFRGHGLADVATQARVHSQLKRAADHLKSLLQMSGDGLRLNSLPITKLPEVAFEMAHLKKIEMVDCDLRELSPALENLFQLETLNLTGAKNLKDLPRAVGQLPHLQELTLSDTGIHALPPMGGASALQNITVKDSPLASLPADFGALRNLAHLSLSGTQLRDLTSGIGNLSALKTLSLQDNQNLNALPKSLGNLSNLTELTLTGNHIRELPSMSGASSLQKLTVDEPALASLPADFGALGNLAHLSLSNTKLRELPAGIGGLSELKTLSLQGNQKLEALPQSFGHLSGLEELSLTGNRISSLPPMHGVSALKKLTVDDASLTSLPKEIGAQHKKLTHLALSNTQLRTLPSSIGDMSRLLELKLDGNTRLKALPDSLMQLKKLQKLDLSGCERLESLPHSIGKMPNLQELNLQNCKRLTMASLPYSVRFPREGLRIRLPDHLKDAVHAERVRHNPHAQVLLGDLERKGDQMDEAIFDSKPQMNEGEVISLAFHLKQGNDLKSRVQREAERKAARPADKDSPLMRQALAKLYNTSTDVAQHERLKNAALALPAILQRELADLMTADEGQQLVQSIGETAYGVRGNTALQNALTPLAHQIASHPAIRELRVRRGQSNLAAKLTPLVEPLWENARALAPMPNELRKQLTDLLAIEPGRKLVGEISKEAYSAKHRDATLQNLMPVLAARIDADPRSKAAQRVLDRELPGLSRQQQQDAHAMTMTAIVQDHWSNLLAEVKKQGKAPAAGPSGQH
ncbi:leucine-rich repeat domain-containing protein [Ralstonia solanacearum]|uniref:leucine-rich repeat domain-containing protein n=1 Tax=Ralstonia solanacearum TaxID=305 RepID=UPI001E3367DB|nr:leucine-rich repeat domain-containing protein [Ralstonia solanacearum]